VEHKGQLLHAQAPEYVLAALIHQLNEEHLVRVRPALEGLQETERDGMTCGCVNCMYKQVSAAQ
jgi:hypothetical protein